MVRPKGILVWQPIPADQLWEWYWEDLFTPDEIAKLWGQRTLQLGKCPNVTKKWPSGKWVTDQLKLNGIPQRSASERSTLWQRAKERKSVRTGSRRYRKIYEDYYRDELLDGEQVHHKDHVEDNDHPLNLEKLTIEEHTREHVALRRSHNKPSRPRRIPIFEVYMRMAEELAARSHHKTTKVGCVVTSFDLKRVLSVGYNGNAAGLSDVADKSGSGLSGMIHAEENALIQASEHGTDRVMFVTESPCLQCAKLVINAGIKYLYYRKKYRDRHPLKILNCSNVMTCEYSKWEGEEW